ncbi:MAG: substrate-binding domain-containing protein [Methanomassiliicoccales archaeon]|jgi:tungstate transport system substrate-binding protein|nr:substrate-binding domain-containing protein [Methanomassiliicoccales archaeon]
MKGNRLTIVIVVIIIGVLILAAAPLALHQKHTLRIATTTSAYDSGLLDHILPDFEKRYDCKVDVIAVGSGQAMELGKNGDVDVLFVHSPDAENQFVKDGYGEFRRLVCYNQFVIVGPAEDPVNVSQASSATEAFLRIYQNGTAGDAIFVSRGDGSGTHIKEKKIWSLLGLNTSTFSNTWYLSTGQGMGAVLDIAQQEQGYAISDEATFYKRKETGIIQDLEILFKGDPILYNQYSVIPVNHTRWPNINYKLAIDFVNWITSPEIQEMIGNFTDAYGHKLFVPNAGPGTITLSISHIAEIQIPPQKEITGGNLYRLIS